MNIKELENKIEDLENERSWFITVWTSDYNDLNHLELKDFVDKGDDINDQDVYEYAKDKYDLEVGNLKDHILFNYGLDLLYNDLVKTLKEMIGVSSMPKSKDNLKKYRDLKTLAIIKENLIDKFCPLLYEEKTYEDIFDKEDY